MSLQEKMKRLKLTLLPIHKSPTLVKGTLDDESLTDKIKQVVSRGNVESVVYDPKDYGIQSNYKVTYQKDDKDSESLTK